MGVTDSIKTSVPFYQTTRRHFTDNRGIQIKACFIFKVLIINKKFWEELIAYFPSYDKGHTENDASNNSSIVACVFVTAVTFLTSCCLATIRGFFTEPLPGNDKGIFFTEPSPNNDRGGYIDTHTDSNPIS
jgi:hypothetical protein